MNPTKNGGELRCAGSVSSSSPLVAPVALLYVFDKTILFIKRTHETTTGTISTSVNICKGQQCKVN